MQNAIVRDLQLKDVVFIQGVLDRPNIFLKVAKVSANLELTFSWLYKDLKEKRELLDRVIVYCRSIDHCTALYLLFYSFLGSSSYSPDNGANNCTSNRLFAMYHSRVDESDKKAILESMSDPSGSCRVLFATIAFGMGINISNISLVIHLGPPSDIDDYLQEIGRAGRNGKPAHAHLYLNGRFVYHSLSNEMKMYCDNNEQCRRVALLKHFSNLMPDHGILSPLHNCCDICAQSCVCDSCTNPIATSVFEKGKSVHVRVTRAQKKSLELKLQQLRCSLKPANQISQILYVGEDVACGLPKVICEQIVKKLHIINTPDDLESMFGLVEYKNVIFAMIQECKCSNEEDKEDYENNDIGLDDVFIFDD